MGLFRRKKNKEAVEQVLDEATAANKQMKLALTMLRELLELKKGEVNGTG